MHTLVRSTLLAGLTGALTVSAAWAGVGLVPVGSLAPQAPAPVEQVVAVADVPADTPVPAPASPEAALPALKAGEVYVGASKTTLTPDPDAPATQAAFPGARWERDLAKCKPLAPEYVQRLLADTATEVDHLASRRLALAGEPELPLHGRLRPRPDEPHHQLRRGARAVGPRAGASATARTSSCCPSSTARAGCGTTRTSATTAAPSRSASALAADPELAGRAA